MIPAITDSSGSEESRWARRTMRLALRHPAGLAAIISAAGALPALALPFMADDWLNLTWIVNKAFLRTAYGYFRPVYLGTYWIDWALWGSHPGSSTSRTCC